MMLFQICYLALPTPVELKPLGSLRRWNEG